jgi:hypothetical protein
MSCHRRPLLRSSRGFAALWPLTVFHQFTSIRLLSDIRPMFVRFLSNIRRTFVRLSSILRYCHIESCCPVVLRHVVLLFYHTMSCHLVVLSFYHLAILPLCRSIILLDLRATSVHHHSFHLTHRIFQPYIVLEFCTWGFILLQNFGAWDNTMSLDDKSITAHPKLRYQL